MSHGRWINPKSNDPQLLSDTRAVLGEVQHSIRYPKPRNLPNVLFVLTLKG